MACRSILGRVLEAVRKERLIAANPVREVEAPKPRLDSEQVFAISPDGPYPEEFGHLLAGCRPFYRDDFLIEAIGRQLGGGACPEDLVLPGPGGSNGIPRGARAPLSTNNLQRVYKAAVAIAGAELGHLDLRGPHDLRHTFATWLEDAAIPSRVIDELMGHASGRRDHGAGKGTPRGRSALLQQGRIPHGGLHRGRATPTGWRLGSRPVVDEAARAGEGEAGQAAVGAV